MTGGDADIWVCGQCRSVNKLRAKQCYNCRTPKDRAEVDPAAIEGTGHGQLREIALPEFRSSRGQAMLATVSILAVALIQVMMVIAATRVANELLAQIDLIQSDPESTVPADFEAEFTAKFASIATLGVVALGVGVVALVAWSYWLSRVVRAMPALGLGYPAANAFMAFVENFLPGFNLIRVPAIVRDVVRRLEPGHSPGQGRGEALIFAAWIGLIGGFLFPRVWLVVDFFRADSIQDELRNAVIVDGVSIGLVLVGAIFLIALIWRIEGRISRRRAEQLGELSPGPDAEVALIAPRPSTPIGTPTPYDPAAAPFAPARQIVETPGPVVPAAPFAPTPGASVPASEPMVAGPLGAEPAMPTTAELLHRPITAVTGVASIPSEEHIATPSHETPDVERFADARPAWPEPPAAPTAPAVAPPLAVPPPESPLAPTAPSAQPQPAPFAQPEPAPLAEPASFAQPEAGSPARVPTGPRLHVRVNSATSMIATLDGESEAISIQELRAAADALARADGSIVIAATPTNFDARRLAQQVFEMFSAAQVPTTMED
ncbi:MAG: hypothetical protein QOD78_1106 [Chloroflexota bacterium]|nr:hypothetical protein [Chloroflexota bacterium]